MLNLQQMRERIGEGKSVLLNGKLITSVANLPSAAELASTDEEKTAAADDLQAQIQKMQQQLDSLTGEKKASSSETNSETGGSGGSSDDTLEELMKHTRAQLVEKADEKRAQGYVIEIGESDTKAEISQKILDAKKAE